MFRYEKLILSRKILIIFFGVVLFSFIQIISPPKELSSQAWLVLSLLIIMAFWWLTEAIPLSITALLPLVIIPIFSDIGISEVAKPYSNPIIFLLLGGFVLGLGLQRSNLHKRLAIFVLLYIGYQRKNILAGFIISTAFLSMWLSNTATCLLMLPICLSVLTKLESEQDSLFRKILILSIAYSSSIGGMATLIGTAPNAIFAGFMSENYNIDINFSDWMMFSLPLVLFLIFLFWIFISFFIRNEKIEKINSTIFLDEYKKLGKINLKEKVTMAIIFVTISLWIFKKNLNSFFDVSLTDSSIAIFGALLFFIIPIKRKFILDKSWFKYVPWNILVLFGGGLSLAALISSTGLAGYISNLLYFFGKFDIFLIIISLALLISIMTEITSNTATTLLFLPIIVSFALVHEYDIIKITLPVVLAASCAFMMPIATPPNAIAFSTNQIKMSFMASIGFFMNLSAVILASLWIYNFSFLLKY